MRLDSSSRTRSPWCDGACFWPQPDSRAEQPRVLPSVILFMVTHFLLLHSDCCSEQQPTFETPVNIIVTSPFLRNMNSRADATITVIPSSALFFPPSRRKIFFQAHNVAKKLSLSNTQTQQPTTRPTFVHQKLTPQTTTKQQNNNSIDTQRWIT